MGRFLLCTFQHIHMVDFQGQLLNNALSLETSAPICNWVCKKDLLWLWRIIKSSRTIKLPYSNQQQKMQIEMVTSCIHLHNFARFSAVQKFTIFLYHRFFSMNSSEVAWKSFSTKIYKNGETHPPLFAHFFFAAYQSIFSAAVQKPYGESERFGRSHRLQVTGSASSTGDRGVPRFFSGSRRCC